MTAPLTMREFSSLIFGREGERFLVVMIRAGFDASMDSPSGVTAVAGYLGMVETWDRLEAKWQGLLALHDLKKFRLTDVFHKFHPDTALEVVAQFAGVINSSGLRHACAHMRDTDWTALDKSPAYLKLYPERQHACLDLVLGIIAQVAELDFRGMPVSIAFDNDYGN